MTALPPGFITVRIMQFIAVTVALALSAFEYTVYDYFTTVTVLIFVRIPRPRLPDIPTNRKRRPRSPGSSSFG